MSETLETKFESPTEVKTETPKITSLIKTEKVKHPKRVAAGKRLAQISKEAKERKARERLAADAPEYVNYGYLIGAAGLVIGGFSLYYSFKSEKREVRIEEEKVKPEPQNVTIKRKTLDSFDE